MSIAVGGGLESDLARAERAYEPLSRRRTRGCVEHRARRLHADAGDGGDRRRALSGHAARRRTNTPCSRSSAPRPRRPQAGSTPRSCRSPTVMKVADKATGAVSRQGGHARAGRGQPPRHDARGLAALKPVFAGGLQVKAGTFITAGNASQLSDGAAACVLMEAKLAEKRGLEPLGIYRGMAVAGCEPDEMGIGPVFAVPKLLEGARAEDRRHRAVGAQRGVRGAGDLLPRPARHRQREAQRQRRRDRGRPSLRHDRARAWSATR